MIESKSVLPADHPLEMLITSRERDIGGFFVRRLLPYMSHRMVGPFVFFDHMGPADFAPHVGMDVRPHPHIHLSTVTYLFEGAIRHHDSLGSDQIIEPGAINLMTAGHGIVHSERTPEPLRSTGGKMNGIQCWIAVPTETEDGPPSFSHHPATSLPEFFVGRGSYKLLLGSAFDHTAPVPVQSDLFYLEVKLPKGERLTIIERTREAAVYVVSGRLSAAGAEVPAYTMAILKDGAELDFVAEEDSRVMVLGGVTLGARFLFWNFVSSSQAGIDQAKRDWANGPGELRSRFPKVPGDDQEFIPLPQEPTRGTPL
jgi:redox-sensitive bicupin YhaK (pirin superfamily)